MIREIAKNDLTDEYFLLLSQLSGELKSYNVYNMWKAYLEGSSKTYVYINNENKTIGTATIIVEGKFLRCGSSVGHIEDVVVDKSCRTKGVGRELVSKCVEFAQEHDCYKVVLDCSEENIPFYAKCGFRPDAYCMRKDIKD